MGKKLQSLLEHLMNELDFSTATKSEKMGPDLSPKEVDAEVIRAMKKAMEIHRMKTPEEYFKYLGVKIEESRKK